MCVCIFACICVCMCSTPAWRMRLHIVGSTNSEGALDIGTSEVSFGCWLKDHCSYVPISLGCLASMVGQGSLAQKSYLLQVSYPLVDLLVTPRGYPWPMVPKIGSFPLECSDTLVWWSTTAAHAIEMSQHPWSHTARASGCPPPLRAVGPEQGLILAKNWSSWVRSGRFPQSSSQNRLENIGKPWRTMENLSMLEMHPGKLPWNPKNWAAWRKTHWELISQVAARKVPKWETTTPQKFVKNSDRLHQIWACFPTSVNKSKACWGRGPIT